MRKYVITAVICLFLTTSFVSPANSASKCSSSDKATYKKALKNFLGDNKIISLSNEIKAIIEDARSQKSNILGRYVDYTARDIYQLEKQDADITKAENHRDTWEPTLSRLATKCNLRMPSRGDLE